MSHNLRLVILSDIHFPYTDEDVLLDILLKEKDADKVIFLGDNVREDQDGPKFLDLIKRATDLKDVVFIRGNHDREAIPCISSLELILGGKKFTFIHGSQFKIGSDSSTNKFASTLKRINRKLPVLAFATVAKVRNRSKSGDYLILGHSHALAFFPRLGVACAGCFTNEKSFYNDRGYIVIESGGTGLNLTLFSLSAGSESTYQF